jgi:sugar phosphate isomerase/epimerase
VSASVQLFSVREAARTEGWPAAIRRLAELGFRAVEPFGIHVLGREFLPTVRELGLAAPTAHGFLTPDELEATLDVAEEFGVTTVFQPDFGEEYWVDESAIARAAEVLEAASVAAEARGIRVGFHNHDHELARVVDGRRAFWSLVDRLPEGVGVEYDVYWAAIAEVDILDDVRRLGSRAFALHLKDGPYGATPGDQVGLGDGVLPLEEILAAAPDAQRVLSLDRMAADADGIWRAAERSAAWLGERGLL